MSQLTTRPGKPGYSIFSLLVITAIPLAWAYWPTLVEMAGSWSHNPQYSHGYLVPVFSLFVLWLQRQKLFLTTRTGSSWGIVILIAAVVLRLAGTYFNYIWLDPISLLPAIAGVIVLFGGWPIFRITWPAIVFLFFMIPLPHNLSISLAAPLQRVATETSTFALQVLGWPAVAEGNVILLNEFELGVVEACSGLRMLVVFFAIATAVAMFLKKPFWEKGLIVASAVPIAIFSNILRITVTGVLYEMAGKKIAELVFHDLAGWLMMPLALAMLAVELFVLNRLLPPMSEIKDNYKLPIAPQVFSARVKRNRIGRLQDNPSQSNNFPVTDTKMS